MHYLIDGYNVLHDLGLMPRKGGPQALAKARTALVGRVAGWLRPPRDRATVVFDAVGAPPGLPARAEQRGVVIHFPPSPQDADSLLKSLIASCGTPGELTVVSADQEIRRTALARGCPVMSGESFLELLAGPRRHHPPRAAPQGDEKPGSRRDAGHWLREFGGLDEDPSLGSPRPFED
jgi:predicted RNA-binding protein with PIN domain